jgi:hypothetical protein
MRIFFGGYCTCCTMHNSTHSVHKRLLKLWLIRLLDLWPRRYVPSPPLSGANCQPFPPPGGPGPPASKMAPFSPGSTHTPSPLSVTIDSRHDQDTRPDTDTRHYPGTSPNIDTRHDPDTRLDVDTRHDPVTRPDTDTRHDPNTSHDLDACPDTDTRHDPVTRPEPSTCHDTEAMPNTDARQIQIPGLLKILGLLQIQSSSNVQ